MEEGVLVPGRGGVRSEKDPEDWTAADKFTVVLGSAGLSATEVSAYWREWGLYPEQWD
jgi:transposase